MVFVFPYLSIYFIIIISLLDVPVNTIKMKKVKIEPKHCQFNCTLKALLFSNLIFVLYIEIYMNVINGIQLIHVKLPAIFLKKILIKIVPHIFPSGHNIEYCILKCETFLSLGSVLTSIQMFIKDNYLS